MTWKLEAVGHTPAPEGESGWERVERELFADLQGVLSKPKYGAVASMFHGNHVDGEPHVAPEDSITTHYAEDEVRPPEIAALLAFFDDRHLPARLAAVSRAVGDVARDLARQLPDSDELKAGLRKLLEGKDCLVRAAVALYETSAPGGPLDPPSLPEAADINVAAGVEVPDPAATRNEGGSGYATSTTTTGVEVTDAGQPATSGGVSVPASSVPPGGAPGQVQSGG